MTFFATVEVPSRNDPVAPSPPSVGKPSEAVIISTLFALASSTALLKSTEFAIVYSRRFTFGAISTTISPTAVPCELPDVTPHAMSPLQDPPESKSVAEIILLEISGSVVMKFPSIIATVTPVPSIPALW